MLSKFKRRTVLGINLRPKQLFSGGFGARTLEDDDRCGRTATTVTPENVSGVKSLIKKDPKIIYAEMQDIMKISSGSLTRILHDCLGVRKRCVHWVPHNVSEEQKQGRVEWCTHMLRKFDRGSSPRVWDIVTGDESCVHTNTTPRRSNSRLCGSSQMITHL